MLLGLFNVFFSDTSFVCLYSTHAVTPLRTHTRICGFIECEQMMILFIQKLWNDIRMGYPLDSPFGRFFFVLRFICEKVVISLARLNPISTNSLNQAELFKK